MALTRRADGTQPINLVNSTWWNDFYDLLTGVMSDQPVTISNTLTTNKLKVNSLTWLDPQTAYGANFGTITLAIGDNDSGLNWLADGHLQLVVNGSPWMDWQVGHPGGIVAFDSGTPRMIHLYVGTSAPASPSEGDIWIKG